MIACLSIRGFELKAALRKVPSLTLRPAALAPEAGAEPLLGPVTAAAEAAGLRAEMRLGEALAECPGLVLVDRDPAAVEQAWEGIVRGLEGAGFAVESAARGTAYFETRGLERLYGGLEQALRRALAAVGRGWGARLGGAGQRFVAFAAASVAEPDRVLVVCEERTAEFLAPLPLELVPLDPRRAAELRGLGVRRLGDLARLPEAAVAERLGPGGLSGWRLLRGRESGKVVGRRRVEALVERVAFREAVGNELTLQRVCGVLVERLLARPERTQRFVRKAALEARLVGGGSWRRMVTLREAHADPERLELAVVSRLPELPEPVVELSLELVALSEERGQQLELLPAGGSEGAAHLREALCQPRLTVGAGSVCRVVEVAP